MRRPDKFIGNTIEGAAVDNIHIVGDGNVEFINNTVRGAGRHNIYVAEGAVPIPADLYSEIEAAVRADKSSEEVKQTFGERLRQLGYDVEALLSAGVNGLMLLTALAPYVSS